MVEDSFLPFLSCLRECGSLSQGCALLPEETGSGLAESEYSAFVMRTKSLPGIHPFFFF